MPRSDKLYVFITVGMASILVLASIVATILALTGEKEKRPGYESAPAKALVRPNPVSGSIVDLDNAELPPVDDQTYLILHKQTRLLARALATGRGWKEIAWRNGISRDGLISLSDQRGQYAQDLKGAKVRKDVAVDVERPNPVNDPKSEASYTTSTTGFASMISSSGTKLGNLEARVYWQRTGNLWQISDVAIQLDLSEIDDQDPINPEAGGVVESPSADPESDVLSLPGG